MGGLTDVRNTTLFVSAEPVRMLIWCVAYNISDKYSLLSKNQRSRYMEL